MRTSLRGIVLAALALAGANDALAQTWSLTGPTGGDVRALAASPREPRIVYLGTAEGVLYRSDDGGRRWRRLEPGPRLPGMSLDNIVVTPAGDVLLGYWHVSGTGGGVARSSDGGASFRVFEPMARESVRALAIAPSDPARIVAGTLTGVFASDDGGGSWRRISPAGHPELRNVESLAVDPRDADVVYAGTWHLPWKTSDGGRRWRAVAAGMIDDSDVFTMTTDARTSNGLFATACTGIYRSANGGASWSKLRGIPASSRRTRAFAQDPEQPERLFAGTTEGLWASEDGGSSWLLRGDKELVVNALELLPGGVLLVGSEGAGVLRSEDRGKTLVAANLGFSARFVGQLLRDTAGGGRLLAAVRNDRYHSGVLWARQLEGPWTKLASGLEGREVWSLGLSGTQVYAGTDDGVYVHGPGSAAWRRLPGPAARVSEIAALGTEVLLLATDRGLLRSTDGGHSSTAVPLGSARNVLALLALRSGSVLAATALGLYRSDDRGLSFRPLSSGPTAPVHRLLALDAEAQTLFATTALGLFKSIDGGRSFFRCYELAVSEVTGLAVHPNGRTLYAADFARGGIYRSDDAGESWSAIAADGLQPNRVFSLILDPERPERVLAATASGGLHAMGPKSGSATAASH
jgi:photosystem II stability/assembly factor-like uncharacterized protein